MHVIAWAIFAVVAVIMIINALFMIISPRAWLRLPGWIRARGTLMEDKYRDGGGQLQLRVAGGVILASLAWVLSEFWRS
jgi:hypothetical protein